MNDMANHDTIRSCLVGPCDRVYECMQVAWRPHRHVCENFPRNKIAGGGDCTGGKFYIWGGNPGLQRLIEDGMYNHSLSQAK